VSHGRACVGRHAARGRRRLRRAAEAAVTRAVIARVLGNALLETPVAVVVERVVPQTGAAEVGRLCGVHVRIPVVAVVFVRHVADGGSGGAVDLRDRRVTVPVAIRVAVIDRTRSARACAARAGAGLGGTQVAVAAGHGGGGAVGVAADAVVA